MDHRTDVFSFGVVLQELLSGEPPFRGASGVDILHAILREPAPRVEIVPEIAADLQRILDKCLAKDPDERYQDMRDLTVDLRAARRLLDSSTATHGHASLVGTLPAGSGKDLPMPPGQRWSSRQSGVAAGVALALALGYVALRDHGSPTGAGGSAARPTASQPRLVVLPFENLGPPEDAYFAAGMTEEITSRLAGVPGLAVISPGRARSSTTARARP